MRFFCHFNFIVFVASYAAFLDASDIDRRPANNQEQKLAVGAQIPAIPGFDVKIARQYKVTVMVKAPSNRGDDGANLRQAYQLAHSQAQSVCQAEGLLAQILKEEANGAFRSKRQLLDDFSYSATFHCTAE